MSLPLTYGRLASMRLPGSRGLVQNVHCWAAAETFCQNSIVISVVGAVTPNPGITTWSLTPSKFSAFPDQGWAWAGPLRAKAARKTRASAGNDTGPNGRKEKNPAKVVIV